MTQKSITPALAALLQAIPELVPPPRIDQAWVFPPRTAGELESGLVVLSLRPEGDAEADRREVVTVRYEWRPSGKGTEATRELVSRGWAPAERVPRLIEGVLRRLGEQDEEPQTGVIGGDAGEWNRFVGQVSEGMLDRPNGE